MTALSEAPDLPDFEIPEDEDHRASQRLLTDADADRVMHAARTVARLRLEVQARADSLTRPVTTWAAREDAKLARRADYLTALLEDYALRVRAADPHRKTLTTPFGDVATVDQPAVWDVDEAEALAWARENRPELVRAGADQFAKAGAKKLLTVTEDGTVVDPNGVDVPGIRVHPGSVKATVRLALGVQQ